MDTICGVAFVNLTDQAGPNRVEMSVKTGTYNKKMTQCFKGADKNGTLKSDHVNGPLDKLEQQVIYDINPTDLLDLKKLKHIQLLDNCKLQIISHFWNHCILHNFLNSSTDKFPIFSLNTVCCPRKLPKSHWFFLIGNFFGNTLHLVFDQLFLHEEETKSGNFYLK